MGTALAIRDDQTAEALRRQARREPNRRAALRMLAIANALEGMSRAEAARLAGMERQAMRDAVVRYNAEGLAGLHDRAKPGRPQRLSEGEQAALAARVFRDPDPERDGTVAWPILNSWLPTFQVRSLISLGLFATSSRPSQRCSATSDCT